jgi:hypothetical protein
MWNADCRLMTHPMCFNAARTRGARVLVELLTRRRRRCRAARVLLRHAQAAPPRHVEQGPAPLPEPLPGLPRRQELPGVQRLPRSSGRPALARAPLRAASRTSDRPYSAPAVSLEACTTLELGVSARVKVRFSCWRGVGATARRGDARRPFPAAPVAEREQSTSTGRSAGTMIRHAAPVRRPSARCSRAVSAPCGAFGADDDPVLPLPAGKAQVSASANS